MVLQGWVNDFGQKRDAGERVARVSNTRRPGFRPRFRRTLPVNRLSHEHYISLSAWLGFPNQSRMQFCPVRALLRVVTGSMPKENIRRRIYWNMRSASTRFDAIPAEWRVDPQTDVISDEFVHPRELHAARKDGCSACCDAARDEPV